MTKHISDRFEKIGGDYEDVENTSGAPWPGSQMQARPHTSTSPRTGQRVAHRAPVEINAETGQALDENLEKATGRAVRRQAIEGKIAQEESPSTRGVLEHIFGLNLPRRDRA
jgi:hypothetical protein